MKHLNLKLKKPIILCIMDGLGLNDSKSYNAFYKAKTPNIDKLFKNYPNNILMASEQHVGLPNKQPGNSEVGHLTIGAGRVIFQDLSMINKSIKDKSFFQKKNLNHFVKKINLSKRNVHIVGLISEGGVHSHSDHVFEIINYLDKQKIQTILHIITDGRDTAPKIAYKTIPKFLSKLPKSCLIGSISGRFFAMDRDKRWERTKKFIEMFIFAKSKNKFTSIEKAIYDSYDNNVTDEFIQPTVLNNYNGFKKNDGIIITNFRVDRIKQFVQTLVLSNKENKKLKNLDISVPLTKNILSLTPLTEDLMKYVPSIFDLPNISMGLGEVLSINKLKQLRISETEKYPHVTYFFNGGIEKKYKNEKRILVDSPKVKTYDLKPEMSAQKIILSLEKILNANKFDVVIMNLANPDMVGHTGNMEATIKAVEVIDNCVEKLYKLINSLHGILILTSDHGNCEKMWDFLNNSPHTSHTTNPVPFLLISNNKKFKVRKGSLADIAPTILDLLNIKKPNEMVGNSLIIK